MLKKINVTVTDAHLDKYRKCNFVSECAMVNALADAGFTNVHAGLFTFPAERDGVPVRIGMSQAARNFIQDTDHYIADEARQKFAGEGVAVPEGYIAERARQGRPFPQPRPQAPQTFELVYGSDNEVLNACL